MLRICMGFREGRMKIAFICCIIIMTIITGCSQTSVDIEDSWTYSVVEIDGMTCIRWSSGGYRGGLTCNWNEWEGNQIR